MNPQVPLLARGLSILVLLLAPGALTSAYGGECVQATDAPAIIAAATAARPDSLPPQAKYVLGCTASPLHTLCWRAPEQLPSWRLLRNTRRRLRLLGRNGELVAALVNVTTARDPRVRAWACRALALYGDAAYCDSVDADLTGIENHVMLRVFAGAPGAVDLACARYAGSDRKAVLLDALWYASTTVAVDFIAGIAAAGEDVALRKRAQWMLENPMPVAASWEL